MAICMRSLCRLNFSLTNNLFHKLNLANVGVRFLYTEKSLGVTDYESIRYIFRNQFMTIEDTFRSKMKDVCNKEDGTVFTEDLKAMIHLAQKNEEDLELVQKMILKFSSSNSDLKFGIYVFGTIVMRMYYYLNEPVAALHAFRNPKLTGFFNQISSHQILMSLLFKHQMYEEVKEVYTQIKEHNEEMFFMQSILVIVMAACYKQNTPESYAFALDCWKHVATRGGSVSCRSTTLLASLAINQNAADVALEVLAKVHKQQFVDVRCLKVLAYMHLDKYLQMIPIFKFTLEQDGGANRQTYFSDVIYAIEEKLKESDSKEYEEILYLIEALKKQERLTSHMTLEENLLKPILFEREKRGNTAGRNTRNIKVQAKAGLRDYL